MHPAAIGLLTILLGYAAWSDIKSRILPNWLSVLILLVALAGVLENASLSAIPLHLAHTIAALALGMGLFAMRWIGAGDAKLYAACAAAFPIAAAPLMLGFVAVSMALLVIVWAVLRRVTKQRIIRSLEDSDRPDFSKLPLGVAIAVGALIPLWRAVQW